VQTFSGTLRKDLVHLVRQVHPGVKKAEIELSALSQQRFNRRIATQFELEREVKTWVNERNQRGVRID
jgi:hypothetical protein